MDIQKRLGDAAWRGISFGGMLGFYLNFLFIPASITMNANIHHHSIMRLMIGILSMIPPVSIIVFFYGMIFMSGRHYFGFLPLISKFGSTPDPPKYWYDWPWYLFVNIGNIGVFLLAFIFELKDSEYETAYKAHVQTNLGLLEPGSKKAVPEDLYAGAREAATMEDPAKWAAKMSELAALVPKPEP
jgi:hypothetical protein